MVQTRFGYGERGFSQTQNVLVKLILETSRLPKVGFNFVTRMKNLRQFATSTPARRTPFRSHRNNCIAELLPDLIVCGGGRLSRFVGTYVTWGSFLSSP